MRLLVAIDGSDCSRRAVEALSSLRLGKGDEIRVVSVLDLYEHIPSYYYDDSASLREVKKILDEASGKLKEYFPDAYHRTTVLNGFIKQSLLEISDQWKPDLIAMGSHGRKGFKKFFLGSISNSILLSAPYPVLILKEKNLTTDKHNNVLLAIDGSYHSDAAIECVLAREWPTDVKFHVVSVAASLSDLYCFDIVSETALEQFAEVRKELEKEVQSVIDKAKDKLSKKFGSDRVSGELVSGSLPDEIMKVGKNLPAGLIVLGSHGKNFVDRLIIGSVSYAVASQADCSVEVVKVPASTSSKETKSEKDKAVVS